MNKQIEKLVSIMTEEAPIIKSFDTYCDFYNWTENTFKAAGITKVQGFEVEYYAEGGRVCKYGSHYNDYEFVWGYRATFNDFVRMVNKCYRQMWN